MYSFWTKSVQEGERRIEGHVNSQILKSESPTTDFAENFWFSLQHQIASNRVRQLSGH